MKPTLTTALLFNPDVDYPNAVYQAFADVKALYDIVVKLTDGLLADSPLSLLEVEAVLDSNAIVTRFIAMLAPYGIIEPSERNVDVTLNSCLSSLLAMKIRDKKIYESTHDEYMTRCTQLLDYLVSDERVSKTATINALTKIKSEVTRRIKYVRARHAKPFKFVPAVEKYADREDKHENPEQFFQRVYGRFLARGLLPVHIKYEDSSYYNVLHVWCSRNKKEVNALFEWQGPDRTTDKEKVFRKLKSTPEPTE